MIRQCVVLTLIAAICFLGCLDSDDSASGARNTQAQPEQSKPFEFEKLAFEKILFQRNGSQLYPKFADINGDSKLDLLLGGDGDGLSIHLRRGSINSDIAFESPYSPRPKGPQWAIPYG